MAIQTSRDSGFGEAGREVSYNGYTFPNLINAKVSSQVVMDSSERITKYVTYQIEITCVVVGADSPQSEGNSIVKQNIEEIREKLTEPGGALSFTAQGFGDFYINASESSGTGSVKDIKFGPKPRILAWEPIGSNKAVRIVWACETSIPECKDSTPYYEKSLINFEYEVEWGIDESGMTERRIIGEFEIPVRWNRNRVSDTADKYRATVLERIPVLAGYARSHPLINISKDRSVLTFTVLDREIPSDNAYQPGILSMAVTHTLNTTLLPAGGTDGTGGFYKWNSTLSGTVEVSPGYPKALAWWAIAATANHRLRRALNSTYLTTSTGSKGDVVVKRKSFMLSKLSLSEDVFGRSVSFSIGYVLFGQAHEMLGPTGVSDLFNPLNTTWVEWNASVYNQVHNSRGYAQLGHTTADDIQITLCDNNLPTKGSDPLTISDQRLNAVFETPCPLPEASWIDFHSELEIRCDDDVIFHKKLVDKSEQELIATSTISDPKKTEFTFVDVVTGGESGEFQVRTESEFKVVLYGWAVRLGHKIYTPAISKIGGVPAVRIKAIAKPRMLASGKCPIYRLQWRLEYRLAYPPIGDLTVEIDWSAEMEHFQ